MSEILFSTISGECTFEFEEKRSQFIGYAKNVTTEDDARAFISKIKAKHHDARHNCSAYILRDGVMRYSDDGEPQGTAGIPILEVIKKSGLVDVVVVVTRYFGGILLGAGGLVRAYSAACAGALDNSQRADYQLCSRFLLELEYPLYDKMSRFLSENRVRVNSTDFNDKIIIEGLIPTDEFERLSQIIVDAFSGRIPLEFIDNTIEKI